MAKEEAGEEDVTWAWGRRRLVPSLQAAGVALLYAVGGLVIAAVFLYLRYTGIFEWALQPPSIKKE